MKLQIKCTSGKTFHVDVSDAMTVLELKNLIAGQAEVPASQQRLIVRGRILRDDATLDAYEIVDGDSIHVAGAAAPHTQQESSSNSLRSQSSSSGMPSMAGMGGMDSPLMESMMNSPMMQGILSNPELVRSIMMSNPEMRAIIEANPHLSHALSDPELLRQSMNAARNPNVMQEMLRNQDRAIANIESLPGGYNALRRMYEDVQEPLLDAVEQKYGDDDGGETSTQLDVGGQEPQNSPIPNPWGAPGPSTRRPSAPRSSGARTPVLPDFAALMRESRANASAPNPDFVNMFQSMSMRPNSMNQPPVRQNPSRPQGPQLDGANPWAASDSANAPEVKYDAQLKNMQHMGFTDVKVNIQALVRCNGNVNAAIESIIEEQSKE